MNPVVENGIRAMKKYNQTMKGQDLIRMLINGGNLLE